MTKPGTSVTFNMVSREFKNFQFERAGGLFGYVIFTALSQSDASAPWVFQFTVDLDLRENNINNAYHNLSPDARIAVKNLGQDMFSVQQLYLALSTAKLQTSPIIEGFSSTSTTSIVLNTIFLGAYLQTIDESDDGVLLGYVVKATQPVQYKASMVPTNFTYYISTYKGSDGLATSDHDLYTLDYLVMSGGNAFPIVGEFDWNWIESFELEAYDGTNSVRKGIFVEILNNLLSPKLKEIVGKPYVDVTIDNPIRMKFEWSVTLDDTERTFTTIDDSEEPTKVLTFSHLETASDSDTFVPLWGNMSLTSESTASVFLEGNTIKTVSTAKVHARINVEGGVTKGDIVDYKKTTTYIMGVNELGKLSATPKGNETMEDNSHNIDANDWSQFVSGGEVDDLVNKIKDTFSSMKAFLENFDTEIQSALNGSTLWVFPGGETFSIQDISFSDNLDLVSHIKYCISM